MIHRKLLLLPVFTALSMCAKQGMPPGGPVDKTPPEVIRTIPTSGDTLVDVNTSVQVWFSEGIQSSTARDAIFITPYSGEDVKYKWRGKKCTIKFPKPLKSDRTYVVTLGTGIKDYRGNAMKNSTTIAFSTGAILDECEMSGRVYGLSDARGIDVWAYSIEDSLNPDPSVVEPDYIVQCGTTGEFTFTHVSPGLYRLFAVRDRISDRLYESGEDEVGVTFRDVFLSREEFQESGSLYFRMTREDTTGPSVIKVDAVDRHRVTIHFNEAISQKSVLSESSVSIVSADDPTETLRVRQSYRDPMNAQVVHVSTQPQSPGKKYRITMESLRDEAGNPVALKTREATFDGNAEPDTTRPVLVRAVPQPGEAHAGLDGILLTFDEPMDSIRFSDGFSLADTSGRSVQGTVAWNDPAEFVFRSDRRLKSRSVYEIRVLGKDAKDLAGNSLSDTAFTFITVDAGTLSEIAGNVSDPDSSAAGPIYVTARKVGREETVYTSVLAGPGAYRLKDVLPGSYLLESFRDEDDNGRYSLGRPFPFKHSERFTVYGDTVRVRSKWFNEGNDIRLPWVETGRVR